VFKNMNIENFTTKDLVEELQKREGIKKIKINVGEEYFISSSDIEIDEIENDGPAIILIITD